MLVCHVSLEQLHRKIAADLAETASAVEDPRGLLAFATLVDDPASAGDLVDAFFGDIMLEEATAIDDVSAGSAFGAAVDEGATSADVQDATVTTVSLVARAAMLGGLPAVFINSDGASRQANVMGVMVNL